MRDRRGAAGRGAGIVLLACALAATPPAAVALEVVFVIRHAQKDPAGRWDAHPDARPLSVKGVVCAERLAEATAGEGIAAVYSTERTRTLATGAAVSGGRPEVSLEGIDEQARPTADFVSDLRRRHVDDRAILFVGHSNTVTDVVLAFRPGARECLQLLGLAVDGISEERYGDLWRVELEGGETCAGAVARLRLPSTEGIDCSTP